MVSRVRHCEASAIHLCPRSLEPVGHTRRVGAIRGGESKCRLARPVVAAQDQRTLVTEDPGPASTIQHRVDSHLIHPERQAPNHGRRVDVMNIGLERAKQGQSSSVQAETVNSGCREPVTNLPIQGGA